MSELDCFKAYDVRGAVPETLPRSSCGRPDVPLWP